LFRETILKIAGYTHTHSPTRSCSSTGFNLSAF